MAGSGRLADLYGRRRLFLVGLALFGLASVACAAAPSQPALIVARLVQGVGAALTQPLALAHASAILPPERRGWAIGVLASAGTTCLMIGPLAGGLVVETVGWRWVFLLNVPLVALALVLARRFMPESRAPGAPALDRPGLLLLTTGLAALVAGLLHMQEWPPAVSAAALRSAPSLSVASWRWSGAALIPSCRCDCSGSRRSPARWPRWWQSRVRCSGSRSTWCSSCTTGSVSRRSRRGSSCYRP